MSTTEAAPPSEQLSPEAQTALERKQQNRLFIVLLMIGGFFVFELVGARIAHSDVLEADAFHLLMDVLALAISLGALRVSSRKPTPRFTFGLRRAEPLAALMNGVLVMGVATELIRDGVEHLRATSHEAPQSGLMLIVASAALVVNGLNAWLLHGAMHAHGGHGHHHGHSHGHHHHGPSHSEPDHDHHDHDHHDHDHAHGHDHAHAHAKKHEDHTDAHDHHAHGEVEHGNQLNMRGAWLHLMGDALGSVAAFGAGLAIRYGAPTVIDPLASFVVVAILVFGAIRLLRDAALVLFEAAPAHLPVPKVEKALLAVDGIAQVHSLHVWTLGTGHDAITAHVRGKTTTDAELGARASESLRKKFKVEYVTIQVDVD